jgi:hypothetical protein
MSTRAVPAEWFPYVSCLLAMALAVGGSGHVTAQESDSLSVGSRVRVAGPTFDTFVGEVHSLSADSLAVRPCRVSRIALAASQTLQPLRLLPGLLHHPLELGVGIGEGDLSCRFLLPRTCPAGPGSGDVAEGLQAGFEDPASLEHPVPLPVHECLEAKVVLDGPEPEGDASAGSPRSIRKAGPEAGALPRGGHRFPQHPFARGRAKAPPMTP